MTQRITSRTLYDPKSHLALVYRNLCRSGFGIAPMDHTVGNKVASLHLAVFALDGVTFRGWVDGKT